MSCDLHNHSKYSDGSMSPADLVSMASELNLSYFSITDHETIKGITEAVKKADEIGMKFIPGVEIGAVCDVLDIKCKRETSMHILGYYTPENIHNLDNRFDEFEVKREKRNRKIVELMRADGISVTYEDILALASQGIITRGHFAHFMMMNGLSEYDTVRQTIDGYFIDGKKYYVPKEESTPKSCIELIKSTGGICVIAHPSLLKLDESEMDRLFKLVKEYGADGVEAIYVEDEPDMTKMLVRLAKKHDLMITGGSDFHGELKPKIKMGSGYGNLHVPDEVGELLYRRVYDETK